MAKKSSFEAELEKIDAEIARYRKNVVEGSGRLGVSAAASARGPPLPVPPKDVKKKPEKLEKGKNIPLKPAPRSLSPLVAPAVVSSYSLPRAEPLLSKYFIVCVVGLALLAYLAGGVKSFVAVFVLCLFLEFICARHDRSKHVVHAFVVIAALILPLYMFVIAFNDLFSILVAAMFALSFVIASGLFFIHKSKEFAEDIHRSFQRTFAVVFYCHTVALALALLLARLLSYVVVGDSFVTLSYVVLVWVVPCVFLYYFLNRFLYLRFFDRVHVRRDLWKALRAGFGYAVLFAVVVLFVYFLTAMQVTLVQRAHYGSALDSAIGELGKARLELSSVEASPYPEIVGLTVSRELDSVAAGMIEDIKWKRDELSQRSFSLGDYLSDAFFGKTLNDILAVSYLLAYKDDLVSAEEDLFREYSRYLSEKASGFPEGSADAPAHLAFLKDYVISNYRPYDEDAELASAKRDINFASDSYSALVEQSRIVGLTLAGADSPFFDPSSIAAASFASVARHTSIFRDSLLFMFRFADFSSREISNPYVIDRLYYGWDVEESETSKILRLRIVRSEYDAWKAVYGGG